MTLNRLQKTVAVVESEDFALWEKKEYRLVLLLYYTF